MSNTEPKIRLEPKDKDLIVIEASEKQIVLQLSVRGTPYENVSWSLHSNNMRSNYLLGGSETIRAVLPSFLSGYPIDVRAIFSGSKKKQEESSLVKISSTEANNAFNFNSVSDVFNFTELNRSFNTQQKLSVKNVIWADNVREPILKEKRYHKSQIKNGIVIVYLTGANDKEVKYKLFYNGEEQKDIHTSVAYKDILMLPFEIPDKYIQKPNKVVWIRIKILSCSDTRLKNILNLRQDLSNKIQLHDNEWIIIDPISRIEVVVVGPILINNNNFEPCKFTRVKLGKAADEPAILNKLFKEVKDFMGETFKIEQLKELPPGDGVEKEVLIFDQMTTRDLTRKRIYPIVTGNEGVELVLSVSDFETSDCILQKHKHANKVKHDNEDVELEKLEGSISTYQYRHTAQFTYPDIFLPFHYIWPTLAGRKSELVLNSCRFSNIRISEEVYPDIKWSFGFHIGIERKKKKDSSYPSGYTKVTEMDCGFSFAAEWDNENKDFSFKVKYPFTNLKQNIAETLKGKAKAEVKDAVIKFIDPIVNGNFSILLTAIDNISRFLNSYKDAQENMAAYYAEKNNAMKVFDARKTMEVELKLPKLSFAASWVATTHQEDIGVKLAAAIKGMFIGFKATIDLYACMSKMPYVKAAIVSIDWLLKNFFNISTTFEIVFDGEVAAGADMAYNTASRRGNAELYVGGKLDVSITLEATQETSKSATVETESYGADGETGLFIKLYFRKFAARQEPDTPQEGIYGDLKAGMKALEIGIFKEEESEKKGRGDSSQDSNRGGKQTIKNKEYLFGGKKTLIDEMNFTESDGKDGKEKRDFYRFFIR